MMEPINCEYNVLVKTVMIGEAGVGKTSFCRKLTTGEFSELYSSTIGVDFFIKYIFADSKIFKLQIWDTAGQEKFTSIVTSYFRNAKLVILMYDLNDENSLKKIKKWYDKIDYYCNEDVKVLGIGNKSDLIMNVDLIEIEKFFNERNIPFLNISVKDDNDFTIFESTLYSIVYGFKPNYQHFEIVELEKNNKNKLNCC